MALLGKSGSNRSGGEERDFAKESEVARKNRKKGENKLGNQKERRKVGVLKNMERVKHRSPKDREREKR